MKKLLFLICLLASLAVHSQSDAASVSLDIQVNESARTYSVYASIVNTGTISDGLASFSLDVLGANGASVLTSLVAAPVEFTPPATLKGFALNNNNGGINSGTALNIQSSQNTVGSNATTLTLLDLGVNTPVLLATGTYSTGLTGTLTARLSPGFSFNLLPDGWAGGATFAASSVTSDIVAVPEPSTMALAGIAAVVFFARKKFRRSAGL